MPTSRSRAASARSPQRGGKEAGAAGGTGAGAGGAAGRATTAVANGPTRAAPGTATPASPASQASPASPASPVVSPASQTSQASPASKASPASPTTPATPASPGTSSASAGRATAAGGGTRDRTLSPGRGRGRGKKPTTETTRSPPGTSSGPRAGTTTARTTTGRSTRTAATSDPLQGNGGGRRQEPETSRRSRRRSTTTTTTTTTTAAAATGSEGQTGNAGQTNGTQSNANNQQSSNNTNNAASGGTSGGTSGGATATSAPTRRSSEARPHSGAPPTYEEAANHLTLEYGGYFVPYESRPITTPLTTVPSLSFSQMNLAASAAAGRNRVGSVSSVGGSSTYVGGGRRLVADQLSPRRGHPGRGRASRRVGDLAVTASDRVVMTPAVIRDLEEGEEGDEEGSDRCTRLLLPPMHICMATTCLVCNCVLPGSGTLVAAFGLFCCTKSSEWSCGRKMASSCLCLLVALAQLILTPVLLIGWIWSILWGFAYVGVSHQEYHGIKDDEEEEDELATIASGRGRLRMTEIDDDDPTPAWALGYHRFDHPGSAPSQRRMSFVAPGATGTGNDDTLVDRRRHANMLRATRSYGYVEVHGAHGLYGATDHHHYNSHQYNHRLSRGRAHALRPPGSDAGSSSTLNNNRPMSQTTLTSYINDGMFLGNTSPPAPPRTHPPSLVTVDM